MSSAFVPPGPNNPNKQVTPETIQKLLDENSHYIQMIVDSQNDPAKQGTFEGNNAQFTQILHRNLVWLATVADSNQTQGGGSGNRLAVTSPNDVAPSAGPAASKDSVAEHRVPTSVPHGQQQQPQMNMPSSAPQPPPQSQAPASYGNPSNHGAPAAAPPQPYMMQQRPGGHDAHHIPASRPQAPMQHPHAAAAPPPQGHMSSPAAAAYPNQHHGSMPPTTYSNNTMQTSTTYTNYPYNSTSATYGQPPPPQSYPHGPPQQQPYQNHAPSPYSQQPQGPPPPTFSQAPPAPYSQQQQPPYSQAQYPEQRPDNSQYH